MALLKGPTAVQILSWPYQGLNHPAIPNLPANSNQAIIKPQPVISKKPSIYTQLHFSLPTVLSTKTIAHVVPSQMSAIHRIMILIHLHKHLHKAI